MNTQRDQSWPVPDGVFGETVTEVEHYTDRLFRFRLTRPASFRFRSGEFVMIGLPGEKPVWRAYSIASPNYEDFLEFLSIKVQDGPLTSRLQNMEIGDPIFLSKKPVGSLVLDDLNPGRRLFLLATGTGLAPFLSIVKDPEAYERFDEVVLVHCVRFKSELAYHDYFQKEFLEHEYLGEYVRENFRYLPTVTREPFERSMRITELIEKGHLGLDPAQDRVMLCGSQNMLRDVASALDALGYQISPNQGTLGDYVIERAFVET
jgi:ferredoxin--NADP+ reductase